MAFSWTLLLVLFDFGWPALPHKTALEIAKLPFPQVQYGKDPCRAQRFARMDISALHGFVSPQNARLAMSGSIYSPHPSSVTARSGRKDAASGEE